MSRTLFKSYPNPSAVITALWSKYGRSQSTAVVGPQRSARTTMFKGETHGTTLVDPETATGPAGEGLRASPVRLNLFRAEAEMAS
ncbi:MAG: hypothetical protein ACHP84_05630 [Caulobacterales bacterium]|jgi:hypothetical protein